ncbi:helix-turn-helix domain-containing protein [Polyangium aurulentum]|uniref:helix-turn-helix domain-containing protein n=1 Tax=Polyangium aurulentum TaxID=2567896 RepID=UPI0010AED662|nr:AraC family transcriptional regulator [Polyangium aurulentum]UQA56394.1 AraC family transcriptional regulator [Polyangium aurulentum]
MERLNGSRIGEVLGGLIADAFAVRASTSTLSSFHAQHGAGIFIGLEREVTVTSPEGAEVRGRVVVIPANLPHATASPGPALGLLYDPERSPRVAGWARARGGAFALEGRLATRLGEALVAHRASLARPDVLDGLAREAAPLLESESASPPRALDRRVARALEVLRDPDADREIVLAQAGLSSAHLQALFVRDVGLPIRTFRLWRRLLRALGASARHDATSAAHLAGFADLAHFSRTCRRMLGYSPTELRSKLLQT